jgi:hypothetical protein
LVFCQKSNGAEAVSVRVNFGLVSGGATIPPL